MNIIRILRKYWLIAIVGVLTIVLIILYLITFNGGLSEDHSQWGEFGNFFGSLTGLLAFIGVIITLIQSRHQVLASEERETFFSLLDIFREHRKNVCIEKAKIVIEPLGADRKIVENEFVTGEIAFKQLADESNYFFLDEIVSNAPGFLKESEMMTILPTEESVKGTPNNEVYQKRAEAIRVLYFKYQNSSKPHSFPLVEYQTWQGLAYQIIQLYISMGKYDALSYAMMRAGDKIYSLYRNQLGPYHRNIFYAFDIVTKFKEENNYAHLFRAQLSKDELILIFFNSFSVESNSTVRKYNYEINIFNNLAWNDIWITQPSYYVDNNLLKSLYDAANEWNKKNIDLKEQKIQALIKTCE